MPYGNYLPYATQEALDLILKERDHQRGLWSDDHDSSHEPEDWLVILSAYMGKLAQCAHPYVPKGEYDTKKLVRRLTQISAISMAAIEALNEELSAYKR